MKQREEVVVAVEYHTEWAGLMPIVETNALHRQVETVGYPAMRRV